MTGTYNDQDPWKLPKCDSIIMLHSSYSLDKNGRVKLSWCQDIYGIKHFNK